MKTRQVWGRLGKLLLREGVDPTFSKKNYRAVVHEVLLFVSETRVIMEIIIQQLEGAHVSLVNGETVICVERSIKLVF